MVKVEMLGNLMKQNRGIGTDTSGKQFLPEVFFCGAGNGGIDSKYYYINEEIRVEYGRKVQNF